MLAEKNSEAIKNLPGSCLQTNKIINDMRDVEALQKLKQNMCKNSLTLGKTFN